MIKIRKTWLIGLLLIVALAATASAKINDVCVVVQDQSNTDVSTDTDCFDIVADDANVTTALAESDFNPQYGLNPSNETILCTVNGLGTCIDPVDVYLLEKGDWKSLSNKKSDLEAESIGDDDVIALVFGDNGLIEGSSVPEMLKIRKITVYIDGDKEATLDANEILDEDGYDVKPGSEVKLKIEFRNVYDDKIDIAIESIEFDELYIENIDDGDDLEPEKDVDEFDLGADNKKTVTIEFTIPLLVDDEEEDTIVMEIRSEDEEGIEYNIDLTNLGVVVDKDSHKLFFKTADLSKTTLECDRSTVLDIELYDIGGHDEDVVLTIKNSALDLDIKEEFGLEEADDEDAIYENTFNIDVGEDATAGTYKITVQAKYDSKSVTEQPELTVKDCAAPTPEEEEEEEEVEVVIPEEDEEPPITGEVILEERTWLEENQYVVVLVLAIIVVILLIIWVVTAMKK